MLEVLREPMESGRITISRAARQSEFPAAFQLVAAMNPCPCGYRGHPVVACRCTAETVARYRMRISGPLLDRIDLQVTVPALRPAELDAAAMGEPSEKVRARVARARIRALRRQGVSNGQLAGPEAEARARLDAAGRTLLREAMERMVLSARARHRVLKVARTIADLAVSDRVAAEHVGEALGFR